MTEQRDPQPLDYRDGGQELRPLVNRVFEAILGAAIGVITVTFLLVVWGMAQYAPQPWPPPSPSPSPPPPFHCRGPLTFSLVVLFILGVVTYAIERRFKRRWFAIAVLLSVGVAALGEGLCFGITKPW